MSFFKNRFCKFIKKDGNICGKEFEPTGSQQKYCPECSKENKKRIEREYRKRRKEKC